MTAKATQDPDDNGTGSRYWAESDNRLKRAGVTPHQVQAVWIKQADAGPSSGFPKYAQTLQGELKNIVQVIAKRYPNARLCYLSSRTFGGYAKTPLNPEPYAYESGLAVKWLIEEQLKGDKDLNFDPAKGPVKAPWLSWGPYLWANGSTKRADGFSYAGADFTDRDGTHESPSGQEKVGSELLKFFSTDCTTTALVFPRKMTDTGPLRIGPAHFTVMASVIARMTRSLHGGGVSATNTPGPRHRYRFGSHPGSYSRFQSFIASPSSRMCPSFGSHWRARPVRWAMLPRWHSSVLLCPSSISLLSFAPPRMAARKLPTCTASPPLPGPANFSISLPFGSWMV